MTSPRLTGRVTRSWYVTLLDRRAEVCVEVEATSKQGARNAAHAWHPHGHIIHVEEVPGSERPHPEREEAGG